MTTELVHLEVTDRVATITLDSPENRNALSLQLVEELHGHLQTAAADESVHVVVLTHTGPAFCAGADLRSRDARVPLPEVLRLLWELEKPVVARVDGHVRAGGIGIVAASDLVFVSPGTTFAFTEVRIGLVPAVISAVVLPRLRHADALELYLLAEPFGSERAVAAGLVTAVAEDVDAAIADAVAKLRFGALRALAASKRLLRGPIEFAELERLSQEFFASEDAREGITAFMEKRTPSWAE
jgi:enoyl-CoA hydratase/carnithine racemase